MKTAVHALPPDPRTSPLNGEGPVTSFVNALETRADRSSLALQFKSNPWAQNESM